MSQDLRYEIKPINKYYHLPHSLPNADVSRPRHIFQEYFPPHHVITGSKRRLPMMQRFSAIQSLVHFVYQMVSSIKVMNKLSRIEYRIALVSFYPSRSL